MSKELATQTTNLPTNMTLADLGISPDDIILPKLLLIHEMSKICKDQKKNQAGDIINSLTGEKLGDLTKPVEVIVLSNVAFKTWTTKTVKGGKFVNSTPYTGVELPKEEKLPDGRDVRNFLTYNFYVQPVTSGEEITFPMLVSFMSASARTGKALNGFLALLNVNKHKPYAKSMFIGSESVPNPEGQLYNRFTVTPGKPQLTKDKSGKEEFSSSYKNAGVWSSMVNKAPTAIKVHADDEDSDISL